MIITKTFVLVSVEDTTTGEKKISVGFERKAKDIEDKLFKRANYLCDRKDTLFADCHGEMWRSFERVVELATMFKVISERTHDELMLIAFYDWDGELLSSWE